MSKHIYMSVGAKKENGLYVDRFDAVTNMMNYRGITDGDIKLFSKKMSEKGHIVIVSDVPLKKHSITEQDDKDFVIDYPKCFTDCDSKGNSQMDALFPNG